MLKKFLSLPTPVFLILISLTAIAVANLTTYTESTLDTLLGNIDSDRDSSISDESWLTAKQDAATAATDTELSTHAASSDHDGRYYTETEVDASLSLKQDAATAQTDTEAATHAGAADPHTGYVLESAAGTAHTRDAEDTLTNGSNLPDGAAIITYGDANWGGGSTKWADSGTDAITPLTGKTILIGTTKTINTLASFTAAQTDANISQVVLNGEITLTGNLEILKPTYVDYGGKITTSTHTLTVSESFDAGKYEVIDATGGSLVFSYGSVSLVRGEWFGTDTAAMQAAINSAPRNSTIELDAGSHTLTTSLYVDRSLINIRFVGLFGLTGQGYPLLILGQKANGDPSDASCSDIRIENLWVSGDNTTDSGGVLFRRASDVKMYNTRILSLDYGVTGDGYVGSYESIGCYFYGLDIRSCDHGFYDPNGSFQGSKVFGGRFEGNVNEGLLTHSPNVKFDAIIEGNNTIAGVGGDGTLPEITIGGSGGSVHISGYIESTGKTVDHVIGLASTFSGKQLFLHNLDVFANATADTVNRYVVKSNSANTGQLVSFDQCYLNDIYRYLSMDLITPGTDYTSGITVNNTWESTHAVDPIAGLHSDRSKHVSGISDGWYTNKGITTPGEVYGAGWNNDYTLSTKHDIYTKIETMGGTGNVNDNTAEAITGVWEIQDDTLFNFGNDADFGIRYDETTDNQLEIVSNSATDTEIDISNSGAGDTNLTVNGEITATGGIIVPANSTAPQYNDLYEDTDDGTNRHRLTAQAYSADRTSTLPDYNIGFLASGQVESDGSIVGDTGSHASPSTTNPLAPTWNGIMHTVWYGATGEIDLPAASGYAGKGILIYNTGAFTVTIDPNGSEVIVREGNVQTGGVSMTLSSGAGNYVALLCDGVRWTTLGFIGTLAAGS